MATSYTNPCGSGDRRSLVLLTAVGLVGTLTLFVDGNTTTNAWFFVGGTTTGILEFWFPSQKIIDEAKWYQQNTAAHGTWKWQGSQDRTTWTDIGGTFTLGGVATQTQTTLAGNTTAYVFYRLLQVSGTASSSPWIYEIEFKIDEGGTTSYLNPLGSGNRTATIATTSSGINWFSASPANLVNGSFTIGPPGSAGWDAAAAAGAWVQFDLGLPYVVQQARWILQATSAPTTEGDWKLQGSPDASAWTDVSAASTVTSTAANWYNCLGQASFNTTPYRYYRLLGVSGSRTTSCWLLEVEFMVAASAGGGAAVATAQAYVWGPL